ncbi:Lipopolysaccharide export system permease protein LptF @ Lipopolysaccharide export system permease protein LptG [uncultured Coleofasciculus sp.]|uniref:Lipopolysaccharide export system permease protein LptF @ Lipopolysaccharide export system permease protein LptG n=1 Tax=uncultured Coleofasciculus sp. TaxID=1267456 RepID=A0A6J4KAP8_9CYAN|nr:Lipopolysaccharide export system permease protein LptF @ Lipopolysaccharide export system permease protein LptG [uncultured Coleofasciculus sp.]
MTFGKSLSPISSILGLSVMDRYLVSELIPPFLFGVGAFSSVGVAIGALFDLVRKITEAGLPMQIAIQVLSLQMPQFIAYAFPMSTLLAAMMTYSRLSSDSELIALRSCGVSVYRMVIPAVVLSLVVTAMTFLFNEKVVPAANYQAAITMQKALKEDKPSFQESNIFYPEYGEVTQPDGQKIKAMKRLFYANQFDGERMKGLTILDWSQQGLNQIVTAESAIWNPGESTWDFFNGTIYVISPDASYRNILRFENQQLKLPKTPLDLVGREKDSAQMNIAQIREYREVIRVTGDTKKVRRLNLRIQQKLAFPFVCLVFGLVGAVLGIQPQRTGKATSFGISVVIIFTYYLLVFITEALGLSGVLTPVLAGWLPDGFGLAAGGFLLYKAAR